MTTVIGVRSRCISSVSPLHCSVLACVNPLACANSLACFSAGLSQAYSVSMDGAGSGQLWLEAGCKWWQMFIVFFSIVSVARLMLCLPPSVPHTGSFNIDLHIAQFMLGKPDLARMDISEQSGKTTIIANINQVKVMKVPNNSLQFLSVLVSTCENSLSIYDMD